MRVCLGGESCVYTQKGEHRACTVNPSPLGTPTGASPSGCTDARCSICASTDAATGVLSCATRPESSMLSFSSPAGCVLPLSADGRPSCSVRVQSVLGSTPHSPCVPSLITCGQIRAPFNSESQNCSRGANRASPSWMDGRPVKQGTRTSLRDHRGTGGKQGQMGRWRGQQELMKQCQKY